ncbi:unnamed protein product [Mytilus edulis]|uniref:Endonuclease/exonuclease/phosphatase domain-containing protein n=1 Tax=Mytilus edulis TaxID=6550 RepID=A0A8S3SLJ4_MYTED|nr:unnamed protein product [Mytilus edulis]
MSSKYTRPLHASTPDKNKNRKPSKKSETPLRLLNVNFQSIKSKQGQALNLIESTNPDIIFETETWVDNKITDKTVVEGAYITTAVPELQTECEIVWCKLELIGHKAIYLSSYYNPKTSNENGYLELEKSLTRANNIKNALIIMAADFNLPDWDWKTKSLKPNTQHTNIHHKFTDILDDHGLQQMVEEPTRESNALDLIIPNFPNSFNKVETIPGISDHDIVFAELNTILSKQTKKPKKISLYKQTKWENIKENLKMINRGQLKDASRLVQRELRRAYWKHIEDIKTPDFKKDKPNCMKRFWTFNKHKRSDRNQIPPLRNNGLLHPDSVEKANILNKQFQSVFF